MKYEEFITKHKDILEFRERPYNKRAYIEEFLILAEKKVKNLNIPDVSNLLPKYCPQCGEPIKRKHKVYCPLNPNGNNC